MRIGNTIEIYTDGSYNTDEECGAGIYSEHLKWQIAIKVQKKNKSNSVAELKAIEYTLELLT